MVGAGGAVGSMARYGVSFMINKIAPDPIHFAGTFVINRWRVYNRGLVWAWWADVQTLSKGGWRSSFCMNLKIGTCAFMFCLCLLYSTVWSQNTKYGRPAHKKAKGVSGKKLAVDFHTFLEKQISQANIVYDRKWKRKIKDSEVYIIYNSYQDPPDTCFDFPFKDIRMTYCSIDLGPAYYQRHGSRWVSRFMINGRNLPIDYDDQRVNPVITPATIRRFRYRDSKFIICWGHLQQYNGYGDRIQFNYFFDITKHRPMQDIYTNFDGMVDYPFLYGDLNNDTLLDRIVYDGISYPFCEDSCIITIKAQTYKNRKWLPLLDADKKPYYIKLLSDGMFEDLRILSYNWMKPLE